jgi:hypothetical protein
MKKIYLIVCFDAKEFQVTTPMAFTSEALAHRFVLDCMEEDEEKECHFRVETIELDPEVFSKEDMN